MRYLDLFIGRLLMLLSDGSLRRSCKQTIRDRSPRLFVSTPVELWLMVRSILNSKKVVGGIVVFISLGLVASVYCSPSLISIIPFKKEFTTSIIDQRIGNAVTLLSGSLAVMAWFYSNIGMREPHAYRLIFRRAYIHLAFFYLILLIIFMLLLSIYREFWEKDTFQRMMIAVHYLYILAFAWLTTLFFKFRHVVDSMKLLEMYGEEFISDSMTEIIRDRMIGESGIEYDQLMNEIGVEKTVTSFFGPSPMANHRPLLAMQTTGTPESLDVFFHAPFVIYDINIKLLRFLLRRIGTVSGDKIYYAPVKLGSSLGSSDAVFHAPSTARLPIYIQIAMRWAFIIKRREDQSDTLPETAYSILNKKLIDYTRDDNKEHVEAILSIYEKVYANI